MTDQTTTKFADGSVSAPRAGLITTGLTFLNVVLGFLFQSVIAAHLGLSRTSDNFQMAWSIVTYGTLIFFTLVPILLVPRIENAKTRVISLGDWPKFVLLGLGLSLAQYAYAGTCEQNLADILRWSAPSHLLAAMTALPQAVAYVKKRFVAAGIGPVMNGAALLVTFLVLGQGAGPAGLGLALASGYLLQFGTVALLALPNGRTYAQSSQVPIRLFLFLIAFTLLSKFQPLLERILSLAAPVGATATLGFGQKIAQGLLLFAAFGLALTANATLSRYVRAGQLDAAAELLAKTIVSTALFTAAVIMAFLPVQGIVIHLLFVRGEFDATDATAVGDVLLCQIPWVIACALTGALTSYLYIEQNYKRVAIASLVGLVATIASGFSLQVFVPLIAVPVASSVGAVLTFGWVAYLVSRSPLWPRLKLNLSKYLALLLAAACALILAALISFLSRLFSFPTEFASSLLTSAVLVALLVYVRLSKVLWAQLRSAIGGRI